MGMRIGADAEETWHDSGHPVPLGTIRFGVPLLLRCGRKGGHATFSRADKSLLLSVCHVGLQRLAGDKGPVYWRGLLPVAPLEKELSPRLTARPPVQGMLLIPPASRVSTIGQSTVQRKQRGGSGGRSKGKTITVLKVQAD